MKRYIEGEDRSQSVLFPERLDDYIDENNPVLVIDAFVNGLDLKALGFEGMEPEDTRRPFYYPACCCRSSSAAISIGSSPAVIWNGRASATSN